MRNLKKVLSLVLCMAVMLSVMVVGAGAAFSDQSKIKNTEAVDACVALNIINGYTDGSYKPEGTITRAEACKMICVALNGGKEPTLGTSATASFTDTKGHWAEGYIESCVTQGIVAGIGGGKFDPEGNVTGSQFAKMLLIALGFNAEHAKFLGAAWEVNVNVKATQKGLYEDLETMDPAVALTRDNAAQMVWNALQAYTVEYDFTLVSDNGSLSSQVVVKDTKETLLSDKYGVIDDQSAVMTDFSYDEDEAEWEYTFGTGFSIGQVPVTTFTSDVDYTDLFQQNVKVIYTVKNGSVDKVYGMFAYKSNVIVEGIVGDIEDLTKLDEATSEVTVNGVDYKLDMENDKNVIKGAYSFGETTCNSFRTIAGMTGYQAFTFKAIDNTDNGKIDNLVIFPFTVEKVSYVGAKTFSTEAVLAGSHSNVKFEKVNAYDGMAKDDYVLVTAAENTTDGKLLFEKLDLAKAKADATKTNKVSFDGTWYKTDLVTTPSAGDDCEYVEVNGYVFYIDAPSNTAGANDFVVVTAAATHVAGLDNTVTAKILKADGKTETVEVSKIGDSVVSDGNDGSVLPEPGVLYTFEIDDDGYYELTVASTLEAKDTDYDYVDDTATFTPATSDDDGYITSTGKKYIDDNAVIFVDEGDDDYSVTTGAKLKATKSAVTVKFVAADDDTNGVYSDVKLAYVETGALGTSDNVYAYVTGEVSVKPDGEKYYAEIPVGDTTLKTKSVASGGVLEDAMALAEGDIFKYTLNANGVVESIDEYTMDIMQKADTTATSGEIAFYAAIIANKGNDICFSNTLMTSTTAIGPGSSVYDAKLTDDTVIIYVDNDKNEIAEGGSIRLADSEKISGQTGYYANIKAVVDASNEEIQLLVIDVNNDMLGIR